MVCIAKVFFSFAFAAGLVSTRAFDADIISDLLPSQADERRALELKSEQFWKPVLDTAKQVKLDEHLALYAEVEAATAKLPAENSHVHGLLSEVVMRLKRADEKVFRQSEQASDIATEQLLKGPGSAGGLFSFLTGGQDYFAKAIRRFIGTGQFSERLGQHIGNRQGDILPALRGAATITANVLEDCRLASKLSFDVLKYDIYNEGVPKTPDALKPLANKLVDASSETRKQFMGMINGAAGSITKDVEGKHDDPSATVTKSLFTDMQPINNWGKGSSNSDVQIIFSAV